MEGLGTNSGSGYQKRITSQNGFRLPNPMQAGPFPPDIPSDSRLFIMRKSLGWHLIGIGNQQGLIAVFIIILRV